MGDNGKFYLKLVKEGYAYNNRHAGAPWTWYNEHAPGQHGHIHGVPLSFYTLIITQHPSGARVDSGERLLVPSLQ